jgi:hypothetical protein
MCEYWAPCTDGKSVKTEKIGQEIAAVISAYSAYQLPKEAGSDVVTVTLADERGVQLSSATAGSYTAKAFARPADLLRAPSL